MVVSTRSIGDWTILFTWHSETGNSLEPVSKISMNHFMSKDLYKIEPLCPLLRPVSYCKASAVLLSKCCTVCIIFICSSLLTEVNCFKFLIFS